MTPSVVAVALGVFVAGAVNGATGLGFAIVSGSVLALVMDAKTAVVMLSVMVPVLSMIQLFRHRAEVKHIRRLLPIFVGGLVGVPVGTYLLAILSPSAVTLCLGVFTVVYVLTSVFKLRLAVAPRWEPLCSPLVGLTGGISSGAIGVAGPILASYLLALNVPAGTFVFSLAMMFEANSLTRLLSLITLQQLTPALLGLSLGLIPPAVLGLLTGMWLQSRLPRKGFQRAVLAVLFVNGINLILRGLG